MACTRRSGSLAAALSKETACACLVSACHYQPFTPPHHCSDQTAVEYTTAMRIGKGNNVSDSCANKVKCSQNCQRCLHVDTPTLPLHALACKRNRPAGCKQSSLLLVCSVVSSLQARRSPKRGCVASRASTCLRSAGRQGGQPASCRRLHQCWWRLHACSQGGYVMASRGQLGCVPRAVRTRAGSTPGPVS